MIVIVYCVCAPLHGLSRKLNSARYAKCYYLMRRRLVLARTVSLGHFPNEVFTTRKVCVTDATPRALNLFFFSLFFRKELVQLFSVTTAHRFKKYI